MKVKCVLLWMLVRLLVGCGSQISCVQTIQGGAPLFRVDPAFKALAAQFEKEIGIPVGHVGIIFEEWELKDPDPNLQGKFVVGTCYSYKSGEKRIKILRSFWEESTDLGKEQLLYHELGHCAMGLDHDERLYETEFGVVPLSHMYPNVFGELEFYKELRLNYVLDLLLKKGN